MLSLKALGEDPSLSLPGFWWLTAILGSLLCRDVISASAPTVMWHSPPVFTLFAFSARASPCLFFQAYQSYWIKGPPYFSMTSSQLITSATILFPNKVTYWSSRKDMNLERVLFKPVWFWCFYFISLFIIVSLLYSCPHSLPSLLIATFNYIKHMSFHSTFLLYLDKYASLKMQCC